MAAVKEGDLETVQRMRKSEDINCLTENYGTETTPLHIAAKWGHDEIVTVLLEVGADANRKDNHSPTGLHWACFCEAGMFQALLEIGADIEARTG